jgi:sec-independent protein translocase protein TatB
MEFFGVGAGEAVMILVIMLLVVGPNRFPQVAREAGKYYRMARRYADAVMNDVRGAMDELEHEVGGNGEDLRSLREIGRDLSSGMSSTREEIRRIGGETRDVASGEESGTSGIGGPTRPSSGT